MHSKDDTIQLYRKRARRYDISANLYRALGFREYAYRRMAVEALALSKGDTVIEIGCGTGLNFPLLQERIGASGKIVGIDLTDRMLDQARKRIEHERWSNVELVQADVAHYAFPNAPDGIISTLAITLIPEYDRVIRNGAAALRPGGRFVILDLKKPDNWPMWLIRAGVWFAKPFGVSLDLAERHPWESLARHLSNTSITQLYGGIAYIAVGQAFGRGPNAGEDLIRLFGQEEP